jgi:serine-type D-Ala-D-Ala carboxypeptidase (penicillin-binding protein 5/6)
LKSLEKKLLNPEKIVYKGIMRAFAVLFVLLFPLSALASEITADSYLLVEKDSFSVVAGRDFHRPLPPASTTKVLTTILALEKLNDQEIIVPTKKVLSIPASKLSLVPGRPYHAIDLIKGAMVESANDAAYSLGVAIGGSEERFAELMNAKAREIGAIDSNFENASGLSAPGHNASAYDLALIFRYALENKKFEEIVGTKYFMFNRGTGDVKYMNHNRLLFCFTPSVGGKTGYTRASRHCYVGAFEKDGKTYILSLLGSRNLWTDAVNILQEIYTDVPSPRDISLAKARNNVSLASFDVGAASLGRSKRFNARTVSFTKAKKDRAKTASFTKVKKHRAKTVSLNKAKKYEGKKKVNKARKGRSGRLHRV